MAPRDFPGFDNAIFRDFPGLTERRRRAYVRAQRTALQSEVHTVAGVTSLAYLAVCNFHAASWTAFQLFCGRLPVAAGSLNLAGCALACALSMELTDDSSCVASDLLAELCLRYRKSFPAVTVFRSILRIAKWTATPPGKRGQSWWSTPFCSYDRKCRSMSRSCYC